MKRKTPEPLPPELEQWVLQYLEQHADELPEVEPEPPAPKWICHSEDDREALKNWTLHRLWQEDEESFEVTPPAVAATFRQEWADLWDKDKIEKALDKAKSANDPELLAQFARDNPRLLSKFFQLQFHKRKRGRMKGEGRPTDLPDDKRAALELADAAIPRIRAIWKKAYDGKQNRGEGSAPQAEDIAAAYAGVTRKELANFKKNN